MEARWLVAGSRGSSPLYSTPFRSWSYDSSEIRSKVFGSPGKNAKERVGG